MPREGDPTSELLATLRRCRVTGGLTLAAVCVWSLWPHQSIESQSLAAANTTKPSPPEDVRWVAPNLARKPDPLNLNAFDARLWTLPPKPIEVAAAPPPPPPSPPPAPPPPLKLQLIGILTNKSADPLAPLMPRDSRAALFDPDTSRVYSVPVGGTILRYRVKSITSEVVELVDAQSLSVPPYTLKMRSSEFKPIVPRRGATAGKQPAAFATELAKDADTREPPADDLASGGAK